MNIKDITGDQVIDKLRDNGVDHPCERCGSEDFAFVSTTILSIQQDVSVTEIDEGIAAAIIACADCGNLNFHALQPLGLLD